MNARTAVRLRSSPLFVLSLVGLLGGCAGKPSVGPTPQVAAMPPEQAIVSTETEQLTPAEISAVTARTTSEAYVLGPNDIISVTVYMHPELDVPVPNVNGNVGGAMITSDGTVQLPLIGDIHLGGLTLGQAQAKLTRAYAQYVNAPQVAVEIQQAQSMRYYLLGAFSSPGVKYPGHALDLLDALALGGSVNISGADLYQAYVAQNSQKLPVDLHALLVNGDLTQNIPLASGDAIVIPTSANEDAFVFGSVAKPGAIPFQSGGLSLLQALSAAGLDLTAMTNAQLDHVHIIRARGRSAQFIVVNASLIMKGQAGMFNLEPGDIIYLPPSGVATWNQVINQLLPSLQAIADILNPFVSIKYLSQHNG